MASTFTIGRENLGGGADLDHDLPYEDRAGISLDVGGVMRHVLSVARANLWLIGVIIAGSIIAAVIATLLATPRYTAVGSIEISSKSEQVLGDDLDPASDLVERGETERFLTSQLTIIQSRTVADRVAKRVNAFRNPRIASALQENRESYANDAEWQDAIMKALAEDFRATLPRNSSVVQLEFTSTDPQVSAEMVNAFADEFVQSNLQRRFDSSSYARKFVAEQLQEARARLEASEQDLNAYARSANLIRTRDPSSTDGNTANSITIASLQQLNQEANEAESLRVAAEAHWNAERNQPLFSSPAALASPVVQGLLTLRSEKQAELDSARERYLASHPSVVRLQGELENINEQLTRAATEARNSVRAQFVAAEAAQQRLRSRVASLEGATMEEQARSVRYNTLAREADTNRSIYDGLLQRYRELNASAGVTVSNISVIDMAQPPVEPSAPKPLRNLAIALLLGAVAAGLIVFIKDQLDDRVRVPEEVEQKTGLPLIGVIPRTDEENPVEELNNSKSTLSEAYGSLRSSLLYSTQRGLPKIILVTSAQPAEGKSTTSYAIGQSLAAIGRRTLLIDADLRRPSIHRALEVSNKCGLSSVLVGAATLDEACVSSRVDRLDILPSGPLPPSPAELLSSARMPELLDAARHRYDVVVIDSAPVLGLADAPALAAWADGVLLVIEANRGGAGQLKAALRRLRMMRPNVIGAVLTKFDPTAAGSASSAYAQYDYYRYRTDQS